jgi:hypothetical protein
LDFLLGHYLVSRGEDKRYATLPDLGVVDVPGEDGIKGVILIMNQGNYKFLLILKEKL